MVKSESEFRIGDVRGIRHGGRAAERARLRAMQHPRSSRWVVYHDPKSDEHKTYVRPRAVRREVRR